MDFGRIMHFVHEKGKVSSCIKTTARLQSITSIGSLTDLSPLLFSTHPPIPTTSTCACNQCMYVRTYTHILMYACMHTYMYNHSCMHTRMHAHAHTHTNTHTHTPPSLSDTRLKPCVTLPKVSVPLFHKDTCKTYVTNNVTIL